MVVDTIALTKGLKTTFNKAYKAAPKPDYELLTFTVPSKSDKELYGFLGATPALREWFGERHVDSLKDYEYEIINRDFEATIGVDRNELEDDQYGMIKTRVQEMATKAKRYKDILISALVQASLTGLAYDGAAYCSNRTAPNDNLLAGTGVTDAQLLTDLAVARAAMRAFVDDKGEVMGLKGDIVVCHVGEELAFMKIMESTTVPGSVSVGEANVFNKILKAVICDARLTDDNDWYLLDSSQLLKPFVFQNRKSPQFVALDKANDEQVFMRKKILYGVDMRCNAGYGLFQHCIQTVNA